MKIRMQSGLPYVQVSLTHHNQHQTLDNVVLDTGSAGTIFSADAVLNIGLQLESDDIVREIRGVGGTEFVFSKYIDSLSLGKFELKDFEIEIGTMDYGFLIDGIVGINFLHRVGACIDLAHLEIY
ncbi:retropepsin-like aspartic protease [Candidatus Parabeggiatoa sp. HSG14]|uniref:retropepsin-like aspartic protease n=1 Tax=Candidatus Parabeggiatoa sp. HSG14 TaxID=3055593 RepID=UPI0025A70407|nr:retropepsin-like aspartic protease [Thiotrichales bacterium HSG14]